jgi:hypothetical protein
MMSVGWPLANMAGRRMLKFMDLSALARIGGVLLVLACAAFPFMRIDGGLWLPGVASFLLGAGMGLLTNACTVLVQASVDWSQRGAATSSTVFARTLGSMVGTALLGGVLNGALQLFAHRRGADLQRVRHLLDRHAGADTAPGGLELHIVLDQAMKATFVVMLITAVLALVGAFRMRRHART